MSAASELTRAADTLERLAKAATPGPWRANSETDDGKTGLGCDLGGNIAEKDGRKSGEFLGRCWGWGPVQSNAAYIAAMSPPVALAVAALFRSYASILGECSAARIRLDPAITDWLDPALAVARVVNEGQGASA